MSQIGPDGKFSVAQKLSDVINSKGREESVFIHPDNQTLYFSSNGHVGFGGLDIFMSKKQPDGNWGAPINLGYPINTASDENSLLVGPDGTIAYFASNRKGGIGGLDIYQFEMPKEIRPEKITYTKGKIYDAKTKQPLEANFELIDVENGKTLTQSFSDATGEFFVTITANKNYMVNVNRPGYLFYSENFLMKNKEADFNKPFVIDIPLEPIDIDGVVELKNIFFDVNKWDLKPESKAELEKLTQFLTSNPKLKIELGGHTDNSGDKKFNATLSTNRAKAVYDYLVTNGKIDAARLSYKGYAETKPKVPNDSPENKAKNRRTEFKVILK
ncbi:MAG: OmpA family protein, partial [Flavobacteriales bacterium]|nr:OmpA family protein [Flavobacteriales bacterium]